MFFFVKSNSKIIFQDRIQTRKNNPVLIQVSIIVIRLSLYVIQFKHVKTVQEIV